MARHGPKGDRSAQLFGAALGSKSFFLPKFAVTWARRGASAPVPGTTFHEGTKSEVRPFPDHTINVGGRLLDLGEPRVMGIINVTPDSFYAGSRSFSGGDIARRAERIVSEGGDIIDVGAFSTRPGAGTVSMEEEMGRMRMALGAIRRVLPEAILSIDTFRPEVALMAVEEFGAGIINDVSGGNTAGAFGHVDGQETRTGEGTGEEAVPGMFRLVARLGVPYVLMSSMPDIESMAMEFSRKVAQLRDLGAKDIILDPGLGFGKDLGQNYRVLAHLGKLRELGLPLLLGASRKSMIHRLLGTTADGALNGTTAINTIAMLTAGVSILRVHDVRQCVEAAMIIKETLKHV